MKPFLAALALLGLSAPAAALKPQLSGLLDRQKMPDPAYAAVMGGWVVNVPWAELEPQPGKLHRITSWTRRLRRRGPGTGRTRRTPCF
ncbi:hypothetical protein MSS93_02440 [Deinococcus radiodurans]|nr:hypothetical protein MSS93_02440 [Deinococcus radiodurans]